ncbi:type IVB secretion system protein IcmH/DotU [Paludibacterium purpuratum]|nr:type IVB secretion system protein IcmH/DotU [Paludibacterium purpuratum]
MALQDAGETFDVVARADGPVAPQAALASTNPLLRAALPLLECIPLLKTARPMDDLLPLRDRLMAMVKAFSDQASREGVSEEAVAMARYCLCTLLDETIASTAWGGDVWGRRSLLVTFYHEVSGGERFFRILQWLAQAPEAHLDELEFMHALLALGMEGRYRLIEGGQGALARLRERLYLLLRATRGSADPSLSPSWQGVAEPHARRARRYRSAVWCTPAVVAALLAMFIGLDYRLGLTARQTSDAFEHIPSWPVMAPRPAVASDGRSSRLVERLAAEIQRGFLSVDTQADRTLLTLHVDGLFASGSAQPSADYLPLVRHIGQALANVPGRIVVTGHSDNQPTISGAPDNWRLSNMRADAVVALLAAGSGQPERYAAQGRGAMQPLADNHTPAGRAKNRRVEIAILAPAGSL